MTTDASRDVEGDVDGDDVTDAGRPSLADWLVVSVRPSQMPPPVAESAEQQSEPPRAPDTEMLATAAAVEATVAADATEAAPTTDAASLESHESEAVDGDEPPVQPETPTATPSAEASEAVSSEDPEIVDSSRSLAPQIFSESEDGLDPDVDEELAAVLLSPAARARRAAAVRVAFFLLGAALVLFFLGRRFLRAHSSPPVAASVAAPLLPIPVPAPVTVEAPPEEAVAEEDTSSAEPSISGGLESTGRGRRGPASESTSAAPIVAPAWSVARFPDLPRDVLIACEQAALLAHSAAPPASPAPDPVGER